MIRRKRLWGLAALGLMAAVVGVDRWWHAYGAGGGKADLKPAAALPVTRVVLFNTGVGYYTRGGEVDGEARVDLTFPETDVNDLLKSMVVENFGGGRVAAVSYDARDPAARTLAGFAIDLNDSPTFAQILAQARGEPVEVVVQPSAVIQPGKLTGLVVGVENQMVPAGGVGGPVVSQVLNLWCADGLHAVRLSDVRNLRFTNPSLEGEFRRALDILAANHDTQKKAVTLQFAGEGRRKVQVGYVVEAPIWKASYRLLLDADGKARPHLQTWAAVENPSDEDWRDVKLALVGAGRCRSAWICTRRCTRPGRSSSRRSSPGSARRPTSRPSPTGPPQPPRRPGSGSGAGAASGWGAGSGAGSVVSAGSVVPRTPKPVRAGWPATRSSG